MLSNKLNIIFWLLNGNKVKVVNLFCEHSNTQKVSMYTIKLSLEFKNYEFEIFFYGINATFFVRNLLRSKRIDGCELIKSFF